MYYHEFSVFFVTFRNFHQCLCSSIFLVTETEHKCDLGFSKRGFWWGKEKKFQNILGVSNNSIFDSTFDFLTSISNFLQRLHVRNWAFQQTALCNVLTGLNSNRRVMLYAIQDTRYTILRTITMNQLDWSAKRMENGVENSQHVQVSIRKYSCVWVRMLVCVWV